MAGKVSSSSQIGGGRLCGEFLLKDGSSVSRASPSLSCLPPCPQQIMKDKWINIGYEGEELKPYTEPEEDFGDTKRIGEGQEASTSGSEVQCHRARAGGHCLFSCGSVSCCSAPLS